MNNCIKRGSVDYLFSGGSCLTLSVFIIVFVFIILFLLDYFTFYYFTSFTYIFSQMGFATRKSEISCEHYDHKSLPTRSAILVTKFHIGEVNALFDIFVHR